MQKTEKKRVMLTVKKGPYEEMQAIVQRLNLPQSTVSAVCDDAIAAVLKVFKQAETTGKFTFTDMITGMGEAINEAVKEEKADVQNRKETKSGKKGVKS